MFKKIYIEITNICNLKCNFCPETNREKKFMSVKEFEHIIYKIHNYTNLVCLHVKGEPLLHNELDEFLNILEKYNLKANITTNGTLIKNKLNIIKNSKAVRQINFSIHSITQNEKEMKQYLQDIFESVEQLENVFISYRLWNMRNIKENDINSNIIKKFEEKYNIQRLKKELMKKEFYEIEKNIFINQDTEFEWPNVNKEVLLKKGRCLALKEQLAILVDGTVVPCCLDNNGDIPLGNIFEETIENILKKEYTKLMKNNFENSVLTHKLCERCGFLKRLEEKRK